MLSYKVWKFWIWGQLLTTVCINLKSSTQALWFGWKLWIWKMKMLHTKSYLIVSSKVTYLRETLCCLIYSAFITVFCIYHCFVSRDLDVGWIKRVKVFHTIAYFKCVFVGSGCLSEGYWIPYSAHGCRVCQLLYQRSDADLDSWVSEPWRRNEKDCVEGKTAKEFLFFLKSGWLVNILQKWSTNLTLQTLL